MKRSVYILSAATLSLTLGFTAAACEYHSGYGSPFQSRWSNYEVQQTPMDEDSSLQTDQIELAAKKPVKKKPVFSKAASRASEVAKARVERKARLKAEAETEIAPVTETASR